MAYKPKPIKTTVSGAIADAYSEITSLAEEMRETADNMSNANMEHLPKFELAETAASELEEVVEPDAPDDAIGELEVSSTLMVNKDKRRGLSRDVRLSNAQALLTDAAAALSEADFDKLELPEGSDREELREAAGELSETLEEHGNISVEFPGMYS